VKGSGAHTEGLAVGDQIVKVAGTSVEDTLGVLRALGQASGEVKLVVMRGGEEVESPLGLPERP
jgi:S1-C subfamily serine protease